MLCHPEARQLALFAESDLRAAGFTTTKARTMLALSRLVAVGGILKAAQEDKRRRGAAHQTHEAAQSEGTGFSAAPSLRR